MRSWSAFLYFRVFDWSSFCLFCVLYHLLDFTQIRTTYSLNFCGGDFILLRSNRWRKDSQSYLLVLIKNFSPTCRIIWFKGSIKADVNLIRFEYEMKTVADNFWFPGAITLARKRTARQVNLYIFSCTLERYRLIYLYINLVATIIHLDKKLFKGDMDFHVLHMNKIYEI